ncbi:hypothetical protein, partial [Bordetella parapertussis]|uniref:hypothetical protein n=1 Tax=Bordetella parapertussis TaxID=519 RepID=UPI0035BC2CED
GRHHEAGAPEPAPPHHARTAVGARPHDPHPAAPERRALHGVRTAAIARHTNAFKINEDVVIPLDRMGEYTDHIERINIELSTRN